MSDCRHYDTENHTENLGLRWKIWKQRKVSNAEFFQCDPFFIVTSVTLNNKGKYFSVIITVVFFVNMFQCDFRVFSVSQNFLV